MCCIACNLSCKCKIVHTNSLVYKRSLIRSKNTNSSDKFRAKDIANQSMFNAKNPTSDYLAFLHRYSAIYHVACWKLKIQPLLAILQKQCLKVSTTNRILKIYHVEG